MQYPLKLLFAASLMMLSSEVVVAQSTPRLLISGDYPDPSILRDGEDYYMTHSPFYYAPGLLIWHSTNLIDWEPICRACPEYEGTAMAPDLVKYNDKYYIYYPAMGVNYVITADNIRGPWSKPHRLEIDGIDPGHIADSNGNRYLFTNNGWVVRLSGDGLSTVGDKQKVYDGWVYPDDWETEGDDMYLESPKIIYYNNYYYMTSAEGGTAGPATSHMAVMARSKNIYGPWENSPYNPLIHTYSQDEEWWSKGHGTLFDDADGNWWMVYHAYAKNFHTLGRQTLIEPMEYTEDGWFKPKQLPIDSLDDTKVSKMDLTDDFSSNELGLQWTFWKEYAPNALKFNNPGISITPKGVTPADGRLLLTTANDKSYMVETKITTMGANAGLLLFYNENAYTGISSDGEAFTIHYPNGKKFKSDIKATSSFYARLINRCNLLTIAISIDGSSWHNLEENLDVSALHHNNYFGFFALRPALTTFGQGQAIFNKFTYKEL